MISYNYIVGSQLTQKSPTHPNKNWGPQPQSARVETKLYVDEEYLGGQRRSDTGDDATERGCGVRYL